MNTLKKIRKFLFSLPATETKSSARAISGITRGEWIAYRWVDVTAFGDKEAMFARGAERNPDDAKEAAENWDIFCQAFRDAQKYLDLHAGG